MSNLPQTFQSISKLALRCFLVLAVSACAKNQSGPVSAINDPNEAANRRIHEFNKKIDRALLAPASNGYGSAFPSEVRSGISNFAGHLALPNDAINSTLQGDLGAAGTTLVRFAFNTIFGLAGFLDPAAEFDLNRRDTDFGETMHVWGVKEGAYTEIPFFGPSTTRDTYGLVVDVIMDPFFVVVRQPTRYIGGVAYVVNSMGDRYDYDTTIESILYDSADSYAQARILFLQNRRFELGMNGENTYVDPEFDPYEDPYADF